MCVFVKVKKDLFFVDFFRCQLKWMVSYPDYILVLENTIQVTALSPDPGLPLR